MRQSSIHLNISHPITYYSGILKVGITIITECLKKTCPARAPQVKRRTSLFWIHGRRKKAVSMPITDALSTVDDTRGSCLQWNLIRVRVWNSRQNIEVTLRFVVLYSCTVSLTNQPAYKQCLSSSHPNKTSKNTKTGMLGYKEKRKSFMKGWVVLLHATEGSSASGDKIL